MCFWWLSFIYCSVHCLWPWNIPILQNALVLYAKIQLKLRKDEAEESPLLQQFFDMVVKELDQDIILAVFSSWWVAICHMVFLISITWNLIILMFEGMIRVASWQALKKDWWSLQLMLYIRSGYKDSVVWFFNLLIEI